MKKNKDMTYFELLKRFRSEVSASIFTIAKKYSKDIFVPPNYYGIHEEYRHNKPKASAVIWNNNNRQDYYPVDTQSLFDTFVSNAQQQILQKDIKVVTELSESPGDINISETQFCLVMNNLISNATQFTSQGNITIGYEKRENEYYFFVKDTGCGIDIADRKTFSKDSINLTHSSENTIFFDYQYITALQHTRKENIGIVSKPGEGSMFWFTLPVCPASCS